MGVDGILVEPIEILKCEGPVTIFTSLSLSHFFTLFYFRSFLHSRLRVKSLSELREKHVAGDYVSGTVFSTPEGSFTIR